MEQFSTAAEQQLALAELELAGRLISPLVGKAPGAAIPEGYVQLRYEMGFLRSFKLFRHPATEHCIVEIRGMGIFELGKVTSPAQRRQQDQQHLLAVAQASYVATIGKRQFPFADVASLLDWAEKFLEATFYDSDRAFIIRQLEESGRARIRAGLGIAYVRAQYWQAHKCLYVVARPYAAVEGEITGFAECAALLASYREHPALHELRALRIHQLWAPASALRPAGQEGKYCLSARDVKEAVELDFLVEVV